jgi:hypothetical protein
MGDDDHTSGDRTSDDHTPTNAGYAGGADARQPQPNLQLPKDYWGAEGTWDSAGNWKGGEVHNPIHDVPIPASLDPSQLKPHSGHAPHGAQDPLSQLQIDNLHHAKTHLSDAIANLQSAYAPAEVVHNLSNVLTIANSAVYGQADWDHALAEACRTWIATEPDAGREEQFHHARDEVVAGGWLVFGEIDQWLHQNDQIMMFTQGATALQQLAYTATTAHVQLQPMH